MQNIVLTKEQAAILRDISLDALLNVRGTGWKKEDLQVIANWTQQNLNAIREAERANG